MCYVRLWTENVSINVTSTPCNTSKNLQKQVLQHHQGIYIFHLSHTRFIYLHAHILPLRPTTNTILFSSPKFDMKFEPNWRQICIYKASAPELHNCGYKEITHIGMEHYYIYDGKKYLYQVEYVFKLSSNSFYVESLCLFVERGGACLSY